MDEDAKRGRGRGLTVQKNDDIILCLPGKIFWNSILIK